MKNFKRILALACSVALVGSSLAGCSVEDGSSEKQMEDVAAIGDALEEWKEISGLVSHSSTAGKEETVYAILDADGTLEQTIVSEWVKNPEGSTSIDDRSDLSDITVVKGTAEYTRESDSRIVWNNDGSDIYYQGNSKKDLPVDVKISYELDGKQVNAEELSGASGHVKMIFTYTNQVFKTVKMQGEDRKIYQPFVMISGMMLDNGKAQNITVDHGSTVNSGDTTLVFGVAMPGLQESLGFDQIGDQKVDLEIPQTVTVEADVTDFSLMMTLTVASNTALSQLGLDDMDTIDDLKADLQKLTDGIQEIQDGAGDLEEGAGAVKDGTFTLAQGTQTLSKGTDQLAEGSHSLADGAKQINQGVKGLTNGLGSLKDSTPELAVGVDALVNGTKEVSSGMDQITQNNDALNGGATQVAEGLAALDQSLNSKESQQQMETLVSGSDTFLQGLSQVSGGLSQMVAGYDDQEGNLANLIAGLTQYAEELIATGDLTNLAYASAIQTMVETYQSLYQDVKKTQMGVDSLKKSYNAIDSGIGGLQKSIAGVSQAVGQLASGASQLKTGVISYTAGVSQASSGIQSLYSGLQTLQSKVPDLKQGVTKLWNGANSLSAGTDTLVSGSANLAQGADQVDQGVLNLNNGVLELWKGAGELLDGTGILKDGVVQFHEEGIRKLADIVNQDLETYYDRLVALKDYAEEYTSYAGCEEAMECSVKFIYKTGAIE